MKVAAILYTAASLGVLAFIVMRPPLAVKPAPPSAHPAIPISAPPAPAARHNAPATAPVTETEPSTPPNYGYEKPFADGIRASLHDGEVVALNDGTQDFIGIFSPAEQARGAVIILHGCGQHPDWADVTHPLRTGLPKKGWTTLALQMPILPKEAKYHDYPPLFPNADQRIEAGIQFLKGKGIAPIILAAHDCGANMAMHWVSRHGDAGLAAYIGLGMGMVFPLDKMRIPVLDIYGEKEDPQAIDSAPERFAMLQKAANPHSKQITLPDADHNFHGKDEELTSTVTNWLNSLPL